MVSGIVQSNDNKRRERYHHEWLAIIYIDPLISEVTHENNINIAEINEEEREAFVNPVFDFYENESDSDQNIYAPEDYHRNILDIFEDIEH